MMGSVCQTVTVCQSVSLTVSYYCDSDFKCSGRSSNVLAVALRGAAGGPAGPRRPAQCQLETALLRQGSRTLSFKFKFAAVGAGAFMAWATVGLPAGGVAK